jgi:hypothetical protein
VIGRTKLSLLVLTILFWSLSLVPTEKNKNTILGVIVWKEDIPNSPSHPIANAVAVAYDPAGKAYRSEPTGADGKFSVVVPESVSEFTLVVYEKQQRYWTESPKEPVLNKSHPHDLGERVLGNKSLSVNEAIGQMQVAMLLHGLDPETAKLLLEKVEPAYVHGYSRTEETHGCPAEANPRSTPVAYRQEQLPSLSKQDASLEHLPSRERARMLLNARGAVSSMKKVSAAERRYHEKWGYYAEFEELIKSGLVPKGTFDPPGYCVELRGSRSQRYLMPYPSHYYSLLAIPEKLGASGFVYLSSFAGGPIQYSLSRKGLNSHAPLVTDDFPLNLAP